MSSALRSHNLRGVAPGRSITQVRVHLLVRSFSVSRATPRVVQAMPPKRYSVLASSVGGAVNGAALVSTRSRAGTTIFGLPPSSASAQVSVAGAPGCQRTARGPTWTPPLGTVSATGSVAMVLAMAPARSHTAMARAKSSYGTRREKGATSVVTSTNWPSGDGCACVKSAGRPSAVRASVAASTTISWLVPWWVKSASSCAEVSRS